MSRKVADWAQKRGHTASKTAMPVNTAFVGGNGCRTMIRKKGQGTSINDFVCTTRATTWPRVVLLESVYRTSTDDLRDFMIFPSSLNPPKICACS